MKSDLLLFDSSLYTSFCSGSQMIFRQVLKKKRNLKNLNLNYSFTDRTWL